MEQSKFGTYWTSWSSGILMNDLGGVGEDYEEVLKLTGSTKPVQLLNYLLLGLIIMFSAMSSVAHIFATDTVLHRCLLPECGDTEGGPNNFDLDWLENKVPVTLDGSPEGCLTFEHLDNRTDRCFFEVNNYGPFESCQRWVFNKTDVTIQRTFEMLCSEDEWKFALLGQSKSFAAIFSFLLLGILADRYGRSKVLVISLLATKVFALIKTMPLYFEIYFVLEVCESLFNGGIYNLALILLLEVVPAKLRYLFAILFAPFCKYLGYILVALISKVYRHWQHTYWTVNAPSAVIFLFCIKLLPESIRWLMVRGRLGDARVLILKVIISGKVFENNYLLRKIATWYNGSVNQGDEDFEEESVRTILSTALSSWKIILRYLVCLVLWCAMAFLNFGLFLNPPILPDFMDDLYFRNIVLWLMDVPGFLLALGLYRFLDGPKSIGILLFFSAFSNVANVFVPRASYGSYIYYTKLPLYFLSRAAVSGAFASLALSAVEIFPTKLRATFLGTFAGLGQIFVLAAYYTPYINNLFVVQAVFGFLALFSAFWAAFLLPATTDKPLPMTIAEAEKTAKNVKKPRYKKMDVEQQKRHL
ncbi:organic anion transporter 3-like [Neocloeon triangulifer]|uniref:organic anion transporter 3-like n=1 Tax=Neocloeon triangulifer TaxID=2078957 RepID=UPI00286F0D30|nr:organic anion transporter 3-like [Neocloeon triangulifer]